MVSEPQKITPRYLFSGTSLKNWIFIFLLALICRVVFLSFGEQLPVFWDARLYVSASLGLLGSIDSDEPYAAGSGGREAYLEQYRQYLDGEDIDWLYYTSPTLTEAQKYIFYSGPVYPMLMAGVFAAPWPNDFQAVRYLNSLFDSLTVVFLSLIAYIVWRKMRAAWICAAIQLLYIPLILTSGILGLETITSFLLALLLLLTSLYYHTEKNWLILAAGAIGGLLFLTKPTAALLSGPVFLFLALVYFRQLRFLAKAYLLYSIPFLLLVLPWVAFTSDYYGKPAIRDPEYSTANFRSSSAIEFEGYDLDVSDADFWTYPVFKRITDDPIGYANLVSKKLIRLWWTPHDEFWQGPRGWETVYHRILIILALAGIAIVPFVRDKLLILMLLIILYYTGIHTIFHAVPRYNFNALPALFLLSTAGALFLYGKRHKFAQRVFLTLGCGTILLILLLINDSDMSRKIAGAMSPVIPALATIAGILAVAITSKYIAGLRYTRTRDTVYFWIPVVILCLTTLTGWSRPWLREWAVPITNADTKIGTIISLPDNFRMTPRDEIYLMLDITTTRNSQIPIDITINGLSFPIVDGRSPADKQFYIKGSYTAFEEHMGIDKREYRWYRKLRLKPETVASMLGPDPQLTVTISPAEPLDAGEAIIVYGFDTPDESKLFIPSFEHTSIERFKEFGDRRIYSEYTVSSTGQSSFIERSGKKITDDLSQAPGRQTGRWGIFLYIKRPDFSGACY